VPVSITLPKEPEGIKIKSVEEINRWDEKALLSLGYLSDVWAVTKRLPL